MVTDRVGDIKNTYNLLWEKSSCTIPSKWHFNAVQEVIPDPIVRGDFGIEVGSGCGYDTYIMASENPSVKFISIDVSDGIFKTGRLVRDLGNVLAMKCSALDIAVRGASVDFAYSFGVLHHTQDPERALAEIARVLKRGAPAFLYLYEDHSENPIKHLALKIVTLVRYITIRMPPRILYLFACAASPIVFTAFTLPAKVMKKFKVTAHIAEAMPFNFGTGPFSLRQDLYDRFGAPIEHRFSRREIMELFSACGFSDINVTRLRHTAGWVVWGYKR